MCRKIDIRFTNWNNLYILLMVATSTLLTACSHEETAMQGGQVMKFRMATKTESASRAVPNINNSFIYPSDFTIAVDGENYIYTANEALAAMTSSSPAHFPLSGSSVCVQAYYPSFAMGYSETPVTFTVEHDQSQTSYGTMNYRVSDLMYGVPRETDTFKEFDSEGKIMPTAQSIPLVFDHKMAKISINAITNGSVIKQMTMLNVKRSIDFNPVDTTFSNLAEADDGLGNSILLYDDETGQGGNFTCSAVIPRQGLATGTDFIEVVVEDFPNDQVLHYYLQEDAMFWPGKHYEYNLNITMTGVSVSVRMVPWENSGNLWNNGGNPLEL